jgi:hypothetical protein
VAEIPYDERLIATLRMMRLWLDDIRPCPDGYLHARSVNEAIKLLEAHDCEYASLDHDLGDFAEDGLTDTSSYSGWPSTSDGRPRASASTAPTLRG